MLKSNTSRWIVAALLHVAILPARSFAWNFVGHELIARIAWDQLSPDARNQIRLIIRQHPALQADLLKDMPSDFGDRDAYATIVSASWPDMIRNEHNPWHDKYHKAPWHYINIPFILDGTDKTKLKDADRASGDWTPGTEPTNLVQALKKCEKDLRDPAVSLSDKAIALSWYLHLAGDAHQPLHANTLFENRFPTGDRGGNSCIVRAPVLTTQPSLISIDDVASLPGQNLIHDAAEPPATTRSATGRSATGPATMPSEGPVNLHFYWDNIFGRLAPPRVLDALQNELTTEYPVAALRPQSVDLQYGDWVDESFKIAVHEVRRDGTLAVGTLDQMHQRSHPPFPELPPDYLARTQEISRRQITLAGYRLAAELNDIFAAK